VDTVLVTAAADSLDSRTGKTVEQPVLSVVLPRADVALLNFDRLDPFDAMEIFQYRGDFKNSRKSEAFQPITPLTPAEIADTSGQELSFQNLLTRVQKMRKEVKTRIAELNPSTAPTPEINPTL
jgi:hypothetical protein